MFYLKCSIKTFLVIFALLFVVGCKDNQYIYEEVITIDKIYSQEEEEYYIYFYQEDCPYCEDCYETINEYLEYMNENKCIKLYICDLTDDFNKTIKRAYEGENGQGSSGKYFVDGLTEYTELYISGVPSLIRIDSTKTSYFVTSGRSNIKNHFNEIMKKAPIQNE